MRSDYDEALAAELRERARITFVHDVCSFLVVAGSLLALHQLMQRPRWARGLARVWAAALALQFLVRVAVPALWTTALEERVFQRELIDKDTT